MKRNRRPRNGRHELSEAARITLKTLGMSDYEVQRNCRRVFDELYARRFHGRIEFLGMRDGEVYLRVRDGSWVQRARAFERQFINDLNALCDLGESPARCVRVVVGARPS